MVADAAVVAEVVVPIVLVFCPVMQLLGQLCLHSQYWQQLQVHLHCKNIYIYNNFITKRKKDSPDGSAGNASFIVTLFENGP